MSGTTPDLLRVTVSAGSRRADFALSGAVPVAELLPELAGSVGLLAGGEPAGHRLLTALGQELRPDSGLLAQGIRDGSLLVLTRPSGTAPDPLQDDVAELIAGVVDQDLRPWRDLPGRSLACAAAVLLLALAAPGLVAQSVAAGAGPIPAVPPGLVALVLAMTLLAAVGFLVRVRGESAVAVAVVAVAALHAAVGAFLLAGGTAAADPWGDPLGWAGAAILVTAAVASLGLGENRMWVLPAVVLGAAGLVSGLVVGLSDWSGSQVLTVVVVVVVLAERSLPRLVLGLGRAGAGVRVGALSADQVGRIGLDIRAMHRVLTAATSAVGVVLVLGAPVVVARGGAGVGLAGLCCLTLGLGTRAGRGTSPALAGLVSSLLGAVSVLASLYVLHPHWGGIAAVSLSVGAAFTFARAHSPAGGGLRWARAGDLLEWAALAALLPVLVVVSGPPIRILG